MNIPKLDGPIPLAVLGIAVVFVYASITTGGYLLQETLFLLLYAIFSAYARQIYKDTLYFSGDKKSSDEHRKKWIYYYAIQLIVLPAVFILIYLQFVKNAWNINWDAISSIVLAITAIFIFQQVLETKKSTRYLEYSVRPNAFFYLKPIENEPGKDTYFIIKNASNYKILFYVHITLESENNKKKIQDKYWKEPLHVYPGSKASFPHVLTRKVFEGEDMNRKITAEIKYSVAPSYAPDERRDGLTETWRFEEGEWIGPNGLLSKNINI